MRSRTATVLRIGGELAIIVVGVLIALSADSARESMQERRAEQRHLEALHDDLNESINLLAASDSSRQRIFTALERLLNEDLDATPADSVTRWVYDGLFQIASFEPRLTALADLENANQLSLLTPAVRRGIAELNRQLIHLGRLEDDFYRSQQTMIDPYLVRETPLTPILAVADSLPIDARIAASPDWSGLQAREARNAMAFKLSLGKLATTRRVLLRDHMETLQGLVGQRLQELDGGWEGA